MLHSPLALSNGYKFLTIPNLIPLGERGGTEGGAVVARVDDASAAWYNPAGLAHIDSKLISGNANLFSKFEQDTEETEKSSNFKTLPGFAAYTGLIESWDLRWSVSLAVPADNDILFNSKTSIPSLLDDGVTYLNIDRKVDQSTNFSLTSPGFSLGWKVSDNFRLGASLRFYRIDILANYFETMEAKATTTNDYYRGSRKQYIEVRNDTYRYEVGMQWDLSKNFTWGLMVRSRSFGINEDVTFYQDSSELYDRSGDTYDITQHNFSRDLSSNFQLPWEIHSGLAWRTGKFDFEIDLSHIREINSREFFTFRTFNETLVEQRGNQALVLDNNVKFNTASQNLSSVTYRGRTLTNVSFGGNYVWSTSKLLHFGYFQKRNAYRLITGGGSEQETDVTNQPFIDVKFTGYTTGITSFGDSSHTTIGIQYITTNANNYSSSRVIEDNDTVFSNLNITYLNFLIGGTFYF